MHLLPTHSERSLVSCLLPQAGASPLKPGQRTSNGGNGAQGGAEAAAGRAAKRPAAGAKPAPGGGTPKRAKRGE